MRKRLYLSVPIVTVLLVSAVGAQQYPMMNMIADKVIQKYQSASCEQLWKEKGQPKTDQEKEAVQMLRSNPEMRTAFLNKVAAPIVNKMFECGMIP